MLALNQWFPLNANWVSGDGTKHCETNVVLSGSSSKFYRLLYTNAPPF